MQGRQYGTARKMLPRSFTFLIYLQTSGYACILTNARSSGAAPDRPELLTFIMNGQTGADRAVDRVYA